MYENIKEVAKRKEKNESSIGCVHNEVLAFPLATRFQISK
jgi:hypothetical protein